MSVRASLQDARRQQNWFLRYLLEFVHGQVLQAILVQISPERILRFLLFIISFDWLHLVDIVLCDKRSCIGKEIIHVRNNEKRRLFLVYKDHPLTFLGNAIRLRSLDCS